MLSSVAGHSLKLSVVSAERDVESDNCLASLNQVKIFWVDAGLGGGGLEEELDLLEETGFTVDVEARASNLGDCGGSRERSCD